MSAIRKRSRKICPSLSRPSMPRIGLLAPSATISQSACSVYSPPGAATEIATRSACSATPTTRFCQRNSACGSSPNRSTRNCSTQYCCRLMNAGRRWPGSGMRLNSNTCSSRENTRPTFQLTPLATSRSAHPRRSRISSARFAQQIAREPTLTVLSSSSTRTSMPRCARSIAAVRPIGPAPATITGQ